MKKKKQRMTGKLGSDNQNPNSPQFRWSYVCSIIHQQTKQQHNHDDARVNIYESRTYPKISHFTAFFQHVKENCIEVISIHMTRNNTQCVNISTFGTHTKTIRTKSIEFSTSTINYCLWEFLWNKKNCLKKIQAFRNLVDL